MACMRWCYEKAKTIGWETIKGAVNGCVVYVMMDSIREGIEYCYPLPKLCEINVVAHPHHRFFQPPNDHSFCVVPTSRSYIELGLSSQYQSSLVLIGAAYGFLTGLRIAFLPQQNQRVADPAGRVIPIDVPINIEVVDGSQEMKSPSAELETASAAQQRSQIVIEPHSQATSSTSRGRFFSPQKTFSERLTQINFSGEIPDIYTCPISKNIMNDPVLFAGNVCDRETLLQWLRQPRIDNRGSVLQPINPFTGSPLPKGTLSVYRVTSMRTQIEDFVIAQEKLFTAADSKAQHDCTQKKNQ